MTRQQPATTAEALRATFDQSTDKGRHQAKWLETALAEAAGRGEAMTRQQPATAAGRDLLNAGHFYDCPYSVDYLKGSQRGTERECSCASRILAIEAEAAAPQPADKTSGSPDPEAAVALPSNLADLIDGALYDTPHWRNDVVDRPTFARILAAKVAALASQPAAETARLDVERLAEAERNVGFPFISRHLAYWQRRTELVAAEYARLAMSDPEAKEKHG